MSKKIIRGEVLDTNILIRVSTPYKKKVDEAAKKHGGTSEFTRMLYDEYFKKQEAK